jgi:hypothetical protein
VLRSNLQLNWPAVKTAELVTTLSSATQLSPTLLNLLGGVTIGDSCVLAPGILRDGDNWAGPLFQSRRGTYVGIPLTGYRPWSWNPNALSNCVILSVLTLLGSSLLICYLNNWEK